MPVVLGLLLLPVAVVIVRLIGRDHPAMNGDDALIELRTRDVFTRNTPLLGSYQRYGWNQAGPLYFYLLAIPYRLFGQSFTTIQISVVVMNCAAAIATILIMRRLHGDAAAAVAAALIAVAFHALSMRTLTDPWEPSISVMLLVMLAVVAYEASTGNVRSWFATVLVASLLAQAYASVTTIAIALAVIGIAIGIVRLRRTEVAQSIAKPVLALVALAILLWSPSIIEQLSNSPGNVRAALSYFGENRETLGGRDALGALRIESGLHAPWITNSVPKETFSPFVDVGAGPVLPIAFILFAVAGVVAWRRREWLALQLVTLVAAFGIVGLLSLRTLTRPFFVWILMPYRAFGLLLWLASFVVLFATVPRARNLGCAVAIAVLVGVGALSTADAARAHLGADSGPAAFDAAAARVSAELRALDAPILVRSEVGGQLLTPSGYARDETAVALLLNGVAVVVDVDSRNRFGPQRAHPELAQYELRLMNHKDPMPKGFRELTVVDPLGSTRGDREGLAQSVTRRCVLANGTQPPPSEDASASLRWLENCSQRDGEAKRQIGVLLDDFEDLPRISFRLGAIAATGGL